MQIKKLPIEIQEHLKELDYRYTEKAEQALSNGAPAHRVSELIKHHKIYLLSLMVYIPWLKGYAIEKEEDYLFTLDPYEQDCSVVLGQLL